jgi:hypothetical protein
MEHDMEQFKKNLKAELIKNSRQSATAEIELWAKTGKAEPDQVDKTETPAQVKQTIKEWAKATNPTL